MLRLLLFQIKSHSGVAYKIVAYKEKMKVLFILYFLMEGNIAKNDINIKGGWYERYEGLPIKRIKRERLAIENSFKRFYKK